MKQLSIYFIFILLLSSNVLRAKQNIDVLHLDTSSIPKISFNIIVKNKTKEQIADTQKNDYIIYFNNKQVDYSFNEQKNPPPSSVLVLIDASFSISGGKLQHIKSSAITFVKKLSENDRCALYIFNDTLIKMCDFTTDKHKLITGIDGIRRGGKKTLLYDSAIKAIDILKNDHPKNIKSLLMYSDGFDEYSKHGINSVVKKARLLPVRIFTDGYTNTQDRHLKNLIELAGKTGGLYTYNSTIDLHKEMFSYKNNHVFQFHFKGEHFKKDNYIVVKNTLYNITRNIHFELPHSEKINSSINKQKIIKIVLTIIIFVLLLAGTFIVIALSKKKRFSFKKRTSRKIPGLRKVLDTFKEDIASQEKDILQIKTFDDSDSDFDLFADIFLYSKGKMDIEINQVLSNMYNLDSNKISKLIPFMIHVVKDSNGFEKDINLNLLKEMAQNLNLSLESENDINHLEQWWNKNKEKAAAMAITELKNQYENEHLFGYKKNEDLVFHYIHDNNINTCNVSVQKVNNNECVVIADKKFVLDTILCFYREISDHNIKIDNINNYYFLRLYEITKEKKNTYQLKSHWINSEQMDDDEIQRLAKRIVE